MSDERRRNIYLNPEHLYGKLIKFESEKYSTPLVFVSEL